METILPVYDSSYRGGVSRVKNHCLLKFASSVNLLKSTSTWSHANSKFILFVIEFCKLLYTIFNLPNRTVLSSRRRKTMSHSHWHIIHDQALPRGLNSEVFGHARFDWISLSLPRYRQSTKPERTARCAFETKRMRKRGVALCTYDRKE